MKKYVYILFSIFIIILIYLLYPRTLNLSIYLSSNDKGTTILYKEKVLYLNHKLKYSPNTVLNIIYSPILIYKIQEVTPIVERIMEKREDSFDMEIRGNIPLSSSKYFYTIDEHKNLILGNIKDLVVGYPGISSYMDKHGKLSLFIIKKEVFENMRVGITTTSFSSIFNSELNASLPKGGYIYSLRENKKILIHQGEPFRIEKYGDKLKLSIEGTEEIFNNRLYISGEEIKVLSILRGSPNFNPIYSGILEVNNKPQGLILINEVPMEDYLKKVVPSEMPPSWSIEALKCQAVAARTYALSDALSGRFSNMGFFVDDSTYSQVYNNYSRYPKTDTAVDETKGEVLTYNDIPIDSKYYSASTGFGTNYKNIWFYKDFTSEDKPYLSFKNYTKEALPNSEKEWIDFYKKSNIEGYDDSSPYYRWNISFDKSALINSLNITIPKLISSNGNFIIGKFQPIKDILEINITKRGDGGNVMELNLVLDYGNIILRSDGIIRSAFKLGKEYSKNDIYINKNDGKTSLILSLPSTFFGLELNKDIFTFYGGGFGHGVGMSQYGAMKLANGGMSYKDILNIYYKDVVLGKIY